MKSLICLTMLCLLAGCFMTTESEEPMSVLHFKDARGSATSTSPLIDHGGKVLPTSNTYAIWWGNQSSFPIDAKSGIDALFEGLTGSSFLGVADQYERGVSTSSTFHTNWTDTSSSPPTRNPSVSTIVNEVCKVLSHNGASPDSSAMYFVYTSNFPRNVNYCAWHSYGYCNGVEVQVAYMPNVTGLAGCDPGNMGCNSYSQGTRALANVTSHELMESVTDPMLNAWYSSNGEEVGDLCSWQFQSCVTLTTGSWMLQEEWSNASGGCVQQ